jgi:uncharacterized protein (TIRG00374 family)
MNNIPDAPLVVSTQGTRRNYAWAIVFGLVVSLFFLYLAFRRIVWHDFFSALGKVNLVSLGLCLFGFVLSYGIISIRWKILLSDTVKITNEEAFNFTMIGYLAGIIFPARLGDFGKAILVGRSKQVGGSQVLGIVLLERLMDVFVLLVIAAALPSVMDYSPAIDNALLVLFVATSLAISVVLILAWHAERLALLGARLLKKKPIKALGFVFGLLEQLAAGLSAVRQKRILLFALALTFLAWLVTGITFMGFLDAFQLGALPWYASFFIILLINLGGLIPSSPGGIGVYEYMVILALSYWVTEKSAGLSFAVLTHGMNLLVIALLGGWSLYRQGVSLWKK